MMRKTIVIYSDKKDVVAMRANATGVPSIHIDELITALEARPWPENLRLSPGIQTVERFRNARVINRVFILEGTGVADFLREHCIDTRWFHIRLQSLLAIGESLCHDTGGLGVSRSLAPLNVQWFEIKREMQDARTPEFAYGVGYEAADLSHVQDPMQKSVWSLFDWKKETRLGEDERAQHQFHVARPKGIPAIAWFFGGDHRGLHFPRDTVEIDAVLLERMTRAAARAFRSDIGEMLLYVTGSVVTFHAFSPFLRSVSCCASASEPLDDWLFGRTERQEHVV